jgi:peroxiredoxin
LKRNDLIILTAGLLIGAGLAVLIYYGLDIGRTRANPSQVPEGVNLPVSASIGAAAPDFALRDVDNRVFKLSEMRGKIVVLNFWATWCEPCKLEMPFFEQLHSSGRSDLEILAVNFDESPEQVANFIEELKLSFPILLDPGGEVQNLYRVRGYPTTYLVDEYGVIQYHHIGLITEDQLGSYIEKIGATE